MKNTTPIAPNAERSAKLFGCTVAQAKALFVKNAAGLRQMADKAKHTGKKVNGYTADELIASATAYDTAAA